MRSEEDSNPENRLLTETLGSRCVRPYADNLARLNPDFDQQKLKNRRVLCYTAMLAVVRDAEPWPGHSRGAL